MALLIARQVAAGGLSGAMMLVCVYPLEVVRTRLTANQARHRKDADFNGVLDCLRKTARQVWTRLLWLLSKCDDFIVTFRLLDVT